MAASAETRHLTESPTDTTSSSREVRTAASTLTEKITTLSAHLISVTSDALSDSLPLLSRHHADFLSAAQLIQDTLSPHYPNAHSLPDLTRALIADNLLTPDTATNLERIITLYSSAEDDPVFSTEIKERAAAASLTMLDTLRSRTDIAPSIRAHIPHDIEQAAAEGMRTLTALTAEAQALNTSHTTLASSIQNIRGDKDRIELYRGVIENTSWYKTTRVDDIGKALLARYTLSETSKPTDFEKVLTTLQKDIAAKEKEIADITTALMQLDMQIARTEDTITPFEKARDAQKKSLLASYPALNPDHAQRLISEALRTTRKR